VKGELVVAVSVCMSLTAIIRGMGFAWLGAIGFGVAVVQAEPPHVVFIVTDDQRPDTIGALGAEMIKTPHLDRLVQRGTHFTRAYTGYPICYASRAEMLTGRSAFTALKNYPGGGLNDRWKTLPAVFSEGGYETWHLGKWHVNGTPEQRGYVHKLRHFSSGGAREVILPERDLRGLPLTGYRGWTFKMADGSADLALGIGLTPLTSAQIADGAIEVIEKQRDSSRPLFLHVNFTAPHDPRLWPQGWEGAYRAENQVLPANFTPEHPFDHGNLDGRDEVLIARPLQPDQVRAELAVYAALISDLDQQTGRILAALERVGLMANTLVVFTSDQGLAMGSHGLMGKQNQYEHSIRAPLLVAGPQVPVGESCEALCYLRDLFPTLCELCDLPVPEEVEAKSLVPVLRNQTEVLHRYVIGSFTDTQRMIADARWKWIEYPQVGQQQLFDLERDPLEQTNLAHQPAFREQVERLAKALRSELVTLGDKLEW
jgi:arylsulfatase A-like enzyme